MKGKSEPAISEEKMTNIVAAYVRSPSRSQKWRIGKGFSLKEIRAADVPIDDLRRAGIPIDKRRKSLHQKNVEELGRIYRELVATGALAIPSIEIEKTHKAQVIKHLRKLPEISKNDAEILFEGGIYSISHLAEEDPKTLAKDLDLDVKKVEKWIESAKSVKRIIDAKATFKKLSKISGIKKKYILDLIDLGIYSIDDLINANPEKVAEKLDIDIDEVIYWIEQASKIKGVEIPEAVIEQTKILSKKKKMEETIEEETEYIEEEIEGAKEELEEPEKEIKEGLKEELVSEEVEEVESISEEPEEDVILKAEEELLKCKGIGKKIAQKLIDAGIFSLKELIEADLEELAKSSGITKQKLKKFQEEAEKMV